MFESLLKSEAARRIYRNTFFLSTGSIIAKVIGFVAVAYMVREMDTSDYGKYSTVVQYVAIFAIFADFGIDMTVLRDGSRTRNLEEYQNSVFPLRFMFTEMALLLAVVFTLFLPYPLYLRILIIITAVSMFFGHPTALSEHFNSTFRLTEHMEYISAIQIVRMLVYAILVFTVIHFAGAEPHTMLMCLIAANLLGFLMRWRVSRRFVTYRFSLMLDRRFASDIMRTSKWFGTSFIVYYLIMHLNVQMLYHFTDEKQVAYFSLGWLLVGGLMLFTGAFSTAVYPHSSRNIHDVNYLRKFFKVNVLLAAATSILAVAVGLLSAPVVPFIFGSDYENAVLPLAILIWFVPLRIMLQYGNTLLECADHMVEKQIVYCIVFPVSLVLNYFLIIEHGAVGAALALIVSTGMMTLLIGLFALRYYNGMKSADGTA